uniref:Putative staufen n=1 Tax=Tabanus bromius TaxID=304241 RepID=A0A0K8TRN9_TABBR
MYGKTPITVLQEYCAKNSIERPEYNFMESPDGKSFGCRVEAIGLFATGEGRSKKEAKHDAAANILKKLKLDHPGIDDIPQAPHEQIPMSDAIITLRDLCLQKNHPLPIFEVVRQSGSPEAPEFEVKCEIASIIRFATFSTKKGAKQLAARKLIDILQAAEVEEHEKQVVLLDDCIKHENENLQKKIKTYREYKNSDNKIVPGMLLRDRHDYFRKLDDEIKKKAYDVLSKYYGSPKEQVADLLKALGISYKETSFAAAFGPMHFIELECEIDVVFADREKNIYQQMLQYFHDML